MSKEDDVDIVPANEQPDNIGFDQYGNEVKDIKEHGHLQVEAAACGEKS